MLKTVINWNPFKENRVSLSSRVVSDSHVGPLLTSEPPHQVPEEPSIFLRLAQRNASGALLSFFPCSTAPLLHCSNATFQHDFNGLRARGAVAATGLETITNIALVAAICRRLRTVPFYRTSDGSRIHSRIAQSLPLDLSRLAAKGVAIHPRK